MKDATQIITLSSTYNWFQFDIEWNNKGDNGWKEKTGKSYEIKINPQGFGEGIVLPRRNRFKFVLRKERFGGKPCANELSTCTKHANNDTICWMKEDCTLCPEHCDKPDLPSDKRSPINYPAIPYPGKDPRCVGYCPGKKHISNNYKILSL